ncbi:MAG: hypothetical protein HC927_00345 [Deltaproteobacteria bacterium]|nr:hypothetical protein [Deltaproteobacteria bacterium]
MDWQDSPIVRQIWEGHPPEALPHFHGLISLLEKTDIFCAEGLIEQRDIVMRSKQHNLEPTTSELFFAYMFAKVGCRVRMLRDDEPDLLRSSLRKKRASLPDLHVTTKSGFSFFVEVRRISDGGVDFSSRLERALVGAGLPLRVSPWPLREDLSSQQTDWPSRRQQEDLADEVVRLLVEELQLQHARNELSGTVCVEARGTHKFKFELVAGSEGFVGSHFTEARIVDEEPHEMHFIYKHLFPKVRQRDNWPQSLWSEPYVIAFDNRCSDLGPTAVASTLIGPLRAICGNSRTYTTRAFSAENMRILSRRDWQRLVDAWHAQSCPVAIDAHSQLLAQECMAHVNGVLVHHVNWGHQWFPNPFVRRELCATEMLDIGFDLRPDELFYAATSPVHSQFLL